MKVINQHMCKELYNKFKIAYNTPGIESFQQAIQMAVDSPCSQFYVSGDDAYRYIKCRLKGKYWFRDKGGTDKRKLRAFELIFRRYLELRTMREFQGCTTIYIASFASCSEAPCFFLSYRRAYEIIRQMRKYGEVRKRPDYRTKKEEP